METGHFIEPKEIVFMAAGMAGDKEFKVIPPGFYMTLIEDGLRELKLDSLYSSLHTARVEYTEIPGNLTMRLPKDCFNVKEVYIYSGDICTISNSKKLWHKSNYYTRGNGYIAKDKGDNGNDPFMVNHGTMSGVNNVLFYNVQAGNLMVSSSCRGAGDRIHLVYASTGTDLLDAPIIPVIFKPALSDYVTEAAIRFRMANEPSMIRALQPMHQIYTRRLDKEGFNGSWHNAVMKASRMDDGERNDLNTYLGRGAWATGR